MTFAAGIAIACGLCYLGDCIKDAARIMRCPKE